MTSTSQRLWIYVLHMRNEKRKEKEMIENFGAVKQI